jgi:hypothetical protein
MHANNFRHQEYGLAPRSGQFELLGVRQPDSEYDHLRDQDMSDILREKRVAWICLIHGTFVGDDVLGIFRKVATVLPGLALNLNRLEKKTLDTLLNDAGNYTAGFAEQLARRVNRANEDSAIPVTLFQWSGENSHIGRCDGAVRLLDDLLAQSFPDGARVLLWGHSHGGNVLALLTNLLGASLSAREEFFEAAACFYKPLFRAHLPAWERVRKVLAAEGNPLEHVSLDVATFGTPVRYGWDTRVATRLLHFVNHRPAEGLPAYQAAMPRSLDDILNATYGDFVQQFGIAGTGIAPWIWSWRSRVADRRLRRVVQRGIRRRDLLRRLTSGTRVADAGKTLLVDYDESDDRARRLLGGHAVYTRNEWQTFHQEEVVRRFYLE